MFAVFSSGVGFPSLACGVRGSSARLSLGFMHAVLVLQHLLLVSVTQRLDCCVPDVVKKVRVCGYSWVHVCGIWVHVCGAVGCMYAVVGCMYMETFLVHL